MLTSDIKLLFDAGIAVVAFDALVMLGCLALDSWILIPPIETQSLDDFTIDDRLRLKEYADVAAKLGLISGFGFMGFACLAPLIKYLS